MTALAEWENFYVIVGSSAGALIGLQFVVMTLVAENPLARSEALGKALATPTIVHFAIIWVVHVWQKTKVSDRNQSFTKQKARRR